MRLFLVRFSLILDTYFYLRPIAMKLSAILLTAMSAALLTACEKSDVKPAADNNSQPPSDVIRPNGGDNPEPYNCPACGMG